MNGCMIAHASQKEEDAAREEWFATLDQRRQDREAKELKKKESEKFFREWWDLDKKEREQSQK
jgi:COX assembly protein 1